MRLLIQHRSVYEYPSPAALGPHRIRLRPASHVRARVESYALHVPPEAALRWQQDPAGNHVAYLAFGKDARVAALDVLVELAVDIRPVNPFDFFVDDRCKRLPFEYPRELGPELEPYLAMDEAAFRVGPLFQSLIDELPRSGDTVEVAVETLRLVNRRVRYVIREEPGIWTPEETLARGSGSCRDSAVLLVAALRSRGLAARFVSGYLVQLTDEGMIPDEPKGVGRDVVDLHAWAEVFLPGGGWIGLDATSGLLCGEGHLPLACTAVPALAAPIDGTSDVPASRVSFETRVGRLGHEARPTAPFTDETWRGLLAAADAADRQLASLGVRLTSGGEPTFNSREHADAPEWNAEALGPTKLDQGRRLARELRRRLAPGAALLWRQGKWYPGESLPRWAIEVLAPSDRRAVWRDAAAGTAPAADADGVRRAAEAIARRLGGAGSLLPAYEDPWPALGDEARLPPDVDAGKADVDDPEARRRLARLLSRGLAREAGWVLPLTRSEGRWRSDRWSFRRGRLFLVPGDSPLGLRLPLESIAGAALPPPEPVEPEASPPDPRRGAERDAQARQDGRAVPSPPPRSLRTALCVEARDGRVRVFLPPLASADDFFALVAEVDAVRRELGVDLELEGYPPPASPGLFRLAVSPDPGVLEVNVPPCATGADHAAMIETVFEAALHAGLHTEKYLLDGRLAGSGGGHHVTLGGPSPLESPFVARPDLLASLLVFVQHHPSLSYLFTGLFVGPTSQAPRVDEARHDTLYELEIALERAFDRSRGAPPPWLSDALFRHLLVDLTGNTHRAEISIDKLFDWRTPHGRQGIVELRAFEMPPHPRMAAAQALLARALIAAFAVEPYRHPLVRWGTQLHDRFLLPTCLWRDFEEVLRFLDGRGVPLPGDAYRAFLDLRCPVAGRLNAGGGSLQVRNALEPWNVLGEEATAWGTSRYVDSSVERIEVLAEGLVPGRHEVLVNGRLLPMRDAGVQGERVAGVRFRAWAPPHSLHPHLGIHHPLRLDVLDRWARRSVGACAYHVWHPEGRGYDTPPLTAFEAAARRAQRFTAEGPLPWPVSPVPAEASPDMPFTLDLRRYPGDHPPPPPEPDPDPAERGA